MGIFSKRTRIAYFNTQKLWPCFSMLELAGTRAGRNAATGPAGRSETGVKARWNVGSPPFFQTIEAKHPRTL